MKRAAVSGARDAMCEIDLLECVGRNDRALGASAAVESVRLTVLGAVIVAGLLEVGVVELRLKCTRFCLLGLSQMTFQVYSPVPLG